MMPRVQGIVLCPGLARCWPARVRRLAFLFALLLLPLTVTAEKAALELRVKSAFIYNFTKYITWKDTDETGSEYLLRICVASDKEVFQLMRDTIESKKSQARTVRVLLLNEGDDYRNCDLVYVPDRRTLQPLAKEIQNAGLLTVGEGSEFVDNGGVFAFIIVDDKVRFEINLTSAESKGFKISSKLLSLARRVVY